MFTLNKSFRNGIIACLVVSLFATMFHTIVVNPHDWNGFLMWLPATWIIPLGASTYEYLTERRKQ